MLLEFCFQLCRHQLQPKAKAPTQLPLYHMVHRQLCYPKCTKFTKIHRNFVPSGTQQSIENHQKSIHVPSGDLLSAPECPWMSQMSIQGAKIIQKAIKMDPKTHIWTPSSQCQPGWATAAEAEPSDMWGCILHMYNIMYMHMTYVYVFVFRSFLHSGLLE